ncbi:hypothetical protein [Nocardioides coralli]|uniref:hypothetical protein n=1 Tax=Nocardioides coralli TaxID=2872154 RepID=UPI001CA43639|nr:hypothetical protein [Nocardioides coralli]QZY29599.1 hypothetical protein K6T13_02590 [Nocardioides coralli]
MAQLQSAHAQFAHESEQCAQLQVWWLHVLHVQSVQVQVAQLSEQLAHSHFVHSS